jgi:hypothetical protein
MMGLERLPWSRFHILRNRVLHFPDVIGSRNSRKENMTLMVAKILISVRRSVMVYILHVVLEKTNPVVFCFIRVRQFPRVHKGRYAGG